MIEDSVDQFIRSFNRGQQQGKEAKRVVNKLALKRHFDYQSGENSRNDQLRKDMVVIHQSQSEGITRFKKLGSSFHSRPVTKSVILSPTISIAGLVNWRRFKEHFSHPALNRNKKLSKSYSLEYRNSRLQSHNLDIRNYKSVGI